ncbi:MAG: hypothetical protein ACRDZR_06435 [Acidimicrobiales bacterium]
MNPLVGAASDTATSDYDAASPVIVKLTELLLEDGTVVLVKQPFRRSPARLEVDRGETTTLWSHGHQRLIDALIDLLASDGYIYAEIRAEAEEGSSALWHAINGEIISLAAAHAAAIADLYPNVLPSGSGFDILPFRDAPNLMPLA